MDDDDGSDPHLVRDEPPPLVHALPPLPLFRGLAQHPSLQGLDPGLEDIPVGQDLEGVEGHREGGQEGRRRRVHSAVRPPPAAAFANPFLSSSSINSSSTASIPPTADKPSQLSATPSASPSIHSASLPTSPGMSLRGANGWNSRTAGGHR